MTSHQRTTLKVRVLRFIPFDVGRDISRLGNEIDAYINSRARLTRLPIRSKEEKLLGAEVVRFSVVENSFVLTFNVFPDGYAIAVLEDPHTTSPTIKFDPIQLLQTRRNVHRDILANQHSVSHVLEEHIRGLQSLAGDGRRDSAKASWGRGGYAYVFSAYFFEESKSADGRIFEMPEAQLRVLLEPSLAGLADTPDFEDSNGQTLIEGLRIDDPDIADCEKHPERVAWASWSSVIVLAKAGRACVDDYMSLELRLQHRWFWVYCNQLRISAALSSAERLGSDYLRLLSTEAARAADSVGNIFEPSLGTRYYRILDALLRTSRLPIEAERLVKMAEALRQEEEIEERRRQRNYRTVVEVLLFTFAFLQGLNRPGFDGDSNH
jgi:hypothetical protein